MKSTKKALGTLSLLLVAIMLTLIGCSAGAGASECYLGTVYLNKLYGDTDAPFAGVLNLSTNLTGWTKDSSGENVSFVAEIGASGLYYIPDSATSAENTTKTGTYTKTINSINYTINVTYPTAPISGTIYGEYSQYKYKIGDLIDNIANTERWINVSVSSTIATDGAVTGIALTNPDETLTQIKGQLNTAGDKIEFNESLSNYDRGIWTLQPVFQKGNGFSNLSPNYMFGEPVQFTVIDKADRLIVADSYNISSQGLVKITLYAPRGEWYVGVDGEALIPSYPYNSCTGILDSAGQYIAEPWNSYTMSYFSQAKFYVFGRGSSGITEFYVQSRGNNDFKVRLYDGHDNQTIHSELTIHVVNGEITAMADDYFVSWGDEIVINGTNNLGGDVVFYTNTDGIDSPLSFYGDTSTGVPYAMGSGTSWNATIDTDKMNHTNIYSNIYSIYIGKVHAGFTDYASVNQSSDFDNTSKFDAYTVINLGMMDIVFTATMNTTVVKQGENLEISGVATGRPDLVNFYVFGSNFFRYANASVDQVTDTYSFTKKIVGTDDLPSADAWQMPVGQYYVVVQHPMYDKEFNIVPDAESLGANIYLNESKGWKNGMADASNPQGTILFNTLVRQSSNAARALAEAITSSNIDDRCSSFTFFVIPNSYSNAVLIAESYNVSSYGLAEITLFAQPGNWYVGIDGDAVIPRCLNGVTGILDADGCYINDPDDENIRYYSQAMVEVGIDGNAGFYVQSQGNNDFKVILYKDNTNQTIQSELTYHIVDGIGVYLDDYKSCVTIGDKFNLTGTNTLGGNVIFYVKGTNYPLSFYGNKSTSVPYVIGSGTSWNATIDTDKLYNPDAGLYTIYIAKVHAGFTDYATVNQISDFDNTSKFDAYTDIYVILIQPYITVDVHNGIAVQGENLTISGVATGKPDSVTIYIFGTNFFKYVNASVDSTDGTYSFTQKINSTSSIYPDEWQMASGQYFVVVQHPMYDTDFNIAPVVNPSSSYSDPVSAGDYNILLNETADASIGYGVILFNTLNRQSANAACALCDAILDENIDDMQAHSSFIVFSPSYIIYAIPSEVVKGQNLTIFGDAIGYTNNLVSVELLSTAFAAIPNLSTNSSRAVQTTSIDDDGLWSISVDTSHLDADTYSVSIALGSLNLVTTKTKIVPFSSGPSSSMNSTSSTNATLISGGAFYVTQDAVITPSESLIPGEYVTATMKITYYDEDINIVSVLNLMTDLTGSSCTVYVKRGDSYVTTLHPYYIRGNGLYPTYTNTYYIPGFDLSEWGSDIELEIFVEGTVSSDSAGNSISVIRLNESGTSDTGGLKYYGSPEQTVIKTGKLSEYITYTAGESISESTGCLHLDSSYTPSGATPAEYVIGMVNVTIPDGANPDYIKLKSDLRSSSWIVDLYKNNVYLTTINRSASSNYTISGSELSGYGADILLKIKVEGLVPATGDDTIQIAGVVASGGSDTGGLKSYTTTMKKTGSEYVMYLDSGWNFVSVPQNLSSEYDTAGELFSGVDTADHPIQTYNAETNGWEMVSSSTIISPLNGYWIYATSPTTVRCNFASSSQTPSKNTVVGWNAVGLSTETPLEAVTAFDSTGWDSFVRWVSETQQYDSPIIKGNTSSGNAENRSIYPWYGGWLYATTNGTFTGTA